MKKIRISIFFLGLYLPSGMAAENILIIQHELALEQVARVERYLKETPNAADELAGINLLLQSYQVLRRTEDLLETLMRRYEVLKGNLDGRETVLLQKTIFPALQAMYQRNQRTRAESFSAKVLKDFEGHALYGSINAGIEVIADRYRVPEVGDRPSFAFTEYFTGQKYSTEDLQGNPVLIEFWVTGCDVCEEERPYLKEVYERYKDEGLQVFGFSRSKKEEDMAAFVEEYGVTWPQCLDSLPEHQVAQKLKLIGVPFNMLLDEEGVVEAVNLRGTELLEYMEKRFPSETDT